MALILFSLAARLILVGLGGQYFFGDERRYNRGVEFYQFVVAGNTDRIKQVFSYPEHEGFVMLGGAITVLQRAAARLTPYADWSRPENILFTMKFAAGILALFSVANIALIYRLSRCLGAEPREAFFSAALLALTNSGFYYSRHLLPYDAGLTFALLSLVAATQPGENGFMRGVVGGAWAGVMYHVYNGFWYFVPVLVFAQFYLIFRRLGWQRRMLGFFLGAGLVFLLPIAIGSLVSGGAYLRRMGMFGRTASLGLFSEGATFPWEYWWYAESGFGLLVLALIGWALFVHRSERKAWPPQVIVFLVGFGLAYALLVLFSVGLERIVVYARTLKPLAALACGLGGWSLHQLFERHRSLCRGVLPVLALGGLVNWLPHFTFSFPVETENRIMGTIGNPKRTLTFSGSLYWDETLPVTRPDLMLVNAQMLYPLRQPEPVPEGVVAMNVEHPLAYKPFQYECHSPRERALLRAFPPRILLIQLRQPQKYPDSPPPEMRYTEADRPTGRR
jgi:hypothetical protein